MSLSCISAAASEAVVFLFPPDCFSPHQVSSCCLLLSLFIIVVFLSGAIWAFQPWRFRVFNLFTPYLTTVGDWGVGMFLFSFLSLSLLLCLCFSASSYSRWPGLYHIFPKLQGINVRFPFL
jgi:hypothetical protein